MTFYEADKHLIQFSKKQRTNEHIVKSSSFQKRNGHYAECGWLQDLRIMQDRVYARKITSVDELKQRISDEWDKIDQQLTDSAINSGANVLQPVFLHEADTLSTRFKAQVQTDQQSTAVVRKFCICCTC